MDTLTFISIVDGTASIEDGAGNGDACDLPATFDAYVADVTAGLQKEYPGVHVHYRWENSNRGIGIETLEGEYDPERYDEIVATIQRVAEDVYQTGNFWVPAEEGE
jgi:hypothetical protein